MPPFEFVYVQHQEATISYLFHFLYKSAEAAADLPNFDFKNSFYNSVPTEGRQILIQLVLLFCNALTCRLVHKTAGLTPGLIETGLVTIFLDMRL